MDLSINIKLLSQTIQRMIQEIKPRTKAVEPLFLEMLELVSLGSPYEEDVNKVLLEYNYIVHSKDNRAKLRQDIYNAISNLDTEKSKQSMYQKVSAIERDLRMGYARIFKLLEGYNSTFTEEDKNKVCAYLKLNSTDYDTEKPTYNDYMNRRIEEIRVKGNKVCSESLIQPDLNDNSTIELKLLKDDLFSKMESLTNQVFNLYFDGNEELSSLGTQAQKILTELKKLKHLKSEAE